MMVTKHLSFAEATTTQVRRFMQENADPPARVRANLYRAAVDIFEPAREVVGRLMVTSGYRCPPLNAYIGGATNSYHMEGLAFDVIPLDMDIRKAFDLLAITNIRFDQLIWEYGRWIHMGAPRHGVEPRLQRLAYYELGHKAVEWRSDDPRFLA